MSLNFVANPYSYYNNRNKTGPLYNGKIYVGNPDTDPTIPDNQKQVTAKQEDGTQVPIAQPISTNSGGYAVDSAGNPVVLLVDGNYSIRVNDRLGRLALEQSNVSSGTPLTNEDGVTSVDNISLLRDFEPSVNGQQASLLGHTVAGIGGGIFYYDETDTTSQDNNGTIIVTSGGKRWKRKDKGFVTPEYFGALRSPTDDTNAAAAAHLTGLSVVYTSGAEYVIKDSNRLEIFDGISYIGNGARITVPSDALAPDSGDGFGRFNNNIFYRNSNSPMNGSIDISGFDIGIVASKYNFIGSGDIPDSVREDSLGVMRVHGNVFTGAGTPTGQGGTSTTGFNSGALIDVKGYPLEVFGNEIRDCGNGIVGFNSKKAHIYNNKTEFCGVSRDFTSWSNVASILVRGSLEIDVHDNWSYVTGGSSYFVSNGSSELAATTRTVKVVDNQIIGCGLSGISAGIRANVSVQKDIDSIDIHGNKIIGWCSGINADLHSGVKVAAEDGNGSTLRSVKTSNYVDYLSPWESFNYSTNEVDGSFNDNKTKGNDVGNQFGVVVSADSANGVIQSEVTDTVLNHQRLGFGISNVKTASTDIKVINCGWSRDGSNNAFQIQQGLSMANIEKATTYVHVTSQSRGVNANNSFCTPVRATDVQDHILSITIIDSQSQNRSLRLSNNTAGYRLRILDIVPDTLAVDAGNTYTIDTSSGSDTDKTTIEWPGATLTSQVIGSRQMGPGIREVAKPYTTSSPITTTLAPAAWYKNQSIDFYAGAANTLTLTPDGAETIDGDAGSLVLAANTRQRLYSDGLEWFKFSA